MSRFLDYFQISQRGSTVGREIRGGFTTFLTMAYILFVNPDILSKAGVDFKSAVACTALAAGVCSILMGIASNFPMAMASGMGLNAVVAFTVTPIVVSSGLAPAETAWKVAMGLVVLNGLAVLALVLLGVREAVLRAVPRDLRLAIGAGIGLFIAFIGLVNAGIVKGTPVPSAPITYGDVRNPSTAIALVGLLITAVFVAKRVKGALVLGILLTTGIALLAGVAKVPREFSSPSFTIAFQADVLGALKWSLVPLLLSIMMVDFFDTLGTATAVAEEAKLTDAQGRFPGTKALLVVDSVSASIGGLLGVSSVTSYVESAAGVAEGARTGLHSVVVGILFLAAIFIAPFATAVPAAATAPALILVGFIMITQMARINFDDLETAIPAFLILLTIPLTYSIAHGIGYGFIAYVVIKLAGGKWREPHGMMYMTSAAFAVYFWWGK